MGEHAIVYKKPAILTTVDKRLTITIQLNQTKKINITSKSLDQTVTTTLDDMIKKTQKARKKHQQFSQTRDLKQLISIKHHDLDLIELAIVETFAYYRKQIEKGFTITIESEIPAGSGLGSSAAIAVGVVAVLSAALKTVEVDPAVINENAYTVEKYQHGLPSGGDNTAITYGGLVWYRKESELYKIIGSIPIEVPKDISSKFILINTGTPQETTGEMVLKVSKLKKKNLELLNKFNNDQEEITRNMLTAFKENDSKLLIQLIKQGQKNLESIGVVSKTTQKMIRDIEQTGGAAKICGAGGYKEGSGIVLAYHQDPDQITKIADSYKFNHFKTTIGGPGLKIEQAKD